MGESLEVKVEALALSTGGESPLCDPFCRINVVGESNSHAVDGRWSSHGSRSCDELRVGRHLRPLDLSSRQYSATVVPNHAGPGLSDQDPTADIAVVRRCSTVTSKSRNGRRAGASSRYGLKEGSSLPMQIGFERACLILRQPSCAESRRALSWARRHRPLPRLRAGRRGRSFACWRPTWRLDFRFPASTFCPSI